MYSSIQCNASTLSSSFFSVLPPASHRSFCERAGGPRGAVRGRRRLPVLRQGRERAGGGGGGGEAGHGRDQDGRSDKLYYILYGKERKTQRRLRSGNATHTNIPYEYKLLSVVLVLLSI